MDVVAKPTLSSEQVKEKALELGADLVGIIDCRTLSENPPDPSAPQVPERIAPRSKSAICLAKRMPLGEFLSDHQYAVAYTNAAICRYLERLAYRLSYWLEDNGHPSVPVVMDETDPELKRGSYGYLSLRHVAVEAGLGTFGLEANLLTPEYGPREYFTVVLTEAELESDQRITEQLCIGETCGRCLLSCPTDAILHWTLDKRLCSIAAQVNGISTILRGPIKRLLQQPQNASVVLSDPVTKSKFYAIVRVAEAFGVCPRCIEVCPVGGDYQKHLAKEHRRIPETTPEKEERLQRMLAASKLGRMVPDNPPTNVRFIGPVGYAKLRRGNDPDIAREDAPRS
jgi:epoxyqueuosine reductase QueG